MLLPSVRPPIVLCGPVANSPLREPPERVTGGVRYSARDAAYFSRRALTRHANVWHLWALGVGAVISGHFSGWNGGLLPGGWGGMLIATIIVGVMYLGLTFAIAEMGAALPHTGAAYSFARTAMGPWGGFLTGLAENVEYVLTPAVIGLLYLHLFWRSWYRVRGVRPYRLVFTASTVTLSAHTAWAIRHAFAPADLLAWNRPVVVVAIALAVVAYSCVNSGLVACAITLHEKRLDLRRALGTGKENALEYGTLGLGAITGLLITFNPLWAVMIVPALLVLHRSAADKHVLFYEDLVAEPEARLAEVIGREAPLPADLAERVSRVMASDPQRGTDISRDRTAQPVAGETEWLAAFDALWAERRPAALLEEVAVDLDQGSANAGARRAASPATR